MRDSRISHLDAVDEDWTKELALFAFRVHRLLSTDDRETLGLHYVGFSYFLELSRSLYQQKNTFSLLQTCAKPLSYPSFGILIPSFMIFCVPTEP